jgi:hypothetical protein
MDLDIGFTSSGNIGSDLDICEEDVKIICHFLQQIMIKLLSTVKTLLV